MPNAYDQSAEAWASGPEQVYARLAETLVDAAPVSVDGAKVLDLGAGTGVASRAALAAGAAVVVAVDIALGMLRRSGSLRPVLANACELPFAADSFDLVVAAISLGHVTDPVRALRETRRVGAALLVSAFEAGWTHPVKAAVDEALAPFGYRPPPWYVALKRDTEPQVDDPANLAALARTAGYRDVSVRTVPVATGLDYPRRSSPNGGWAWRTSRRSCKHCHPPNRRSYAVAVESALAAAPPLVVSMVVLAAT